MTILKETAPSFERKLNQIRKGLTEYAILSIVEAHDGIFGIEIIDLLIHVYSKFTSAHSTVYYILSKFRREGLVIQSYEESDTNTPRKYYYITEKGAAFLKEFKAYWSQLVIELADTSRYRNGYRVEDFEDPQISAKNDISDATSAGLANFDEAVRGR